MRLTATGGRRVPRTGGGRPGTAERGTVLLVFPAALLVVVVLGAITLDVGLARVRGAELRAVAASAANDALAALDVTALRTDGTIRLDEARVRAVVAEAVAAGALPQAEVVAVAVLDRAPEPPEVVVTLALEVDLVLAPAVPGAPGSVRIEATEAALVVG